jgi:hypothetical protein
LRKEKKKEERQEKREEIVDRVKDWKEEKLNLFKKEKSQQSESKS